MVLGLDKFSAPVQRRGRTKWQSSAKSVYKCQGGIYKAAREMTRRSLSQHPRCDVIAALTPNVLLLNMYELIYASILKKGCIALYPA